MRQVDRLGEVQSREILGPVPAPSLEQFEQRQRREPRVLPDRCPAEPGERQHPAMHEQDVHEIAGLVAARHSEHLVDREIDGVEQEPAQLVSHQRHEAPRRIVRPVHPGRVFASPHESAHEARQRQLDVDLITGTLQRIAILRERRRNTRFGVMEESQIVTVARGIRREMHGRAAREVPIVVGRLRQRRQQPPLEIRQRHSRAPARHASRLPCFISCSATHATSTDPISRSGRYDQKQVARNRRKARRASRTLTISRAVSGSSTRRLFRPPRAPISARYRLTSDMG